MTTETPRTPAGKAPPAAGTSLIQGRAVAALAARELRSYFGAPTAYVALIVFYLLAGYLFSVPLFLVNQASLRPLADTVPLLLAFLIPALTMGLLAEELKSGTYETLATLPIQDWDIVLGKFLGFGGVSLAVVGGMAFYPVVLGIIVAPPAGLDYGETAGILLGLWLLGLMFGAIGLFASALTRSQIVAFVLAFMICFLFFIAGHLSRFAPPAVAPIIEFIGSDSHLDTLAKGVLDTRDILYFASVTFGFLYLTAQRLSARRFL